MATTSPVLPPQSTKSNGTTTVHIRRASTLGGALIRADCAAARAATAANRLGDETEGIGPFGGDFSRCTAIAAQGCIQLEANVPTFAAITSNATKAEPASNRSGSIGFRAIDQAAVAARAATSANRLGNDTGGKGAIGADGWMTGLDQDGSTAAAPAAPAAKAHAQAVEGAAVLSA